MSRQVFLLSRQVSLLGVRRVSVAPGIPANQTTPLTTSPSYPIWGEGTKVAEVAHTVPPPSPPSWAEMKRRETTLPLAQPPSHSPPGPVSRQPPPLSTHILQLYKDCVARGIWAKLVFETSGDREEYSLFCNPQPREAATAAATTAAATTAATTAAATAAAQQQQLYVFTGWARRKDALPTRDGGNELGGEERPG